MVCAIERLASPHIHCQRALLGLAVDEIDRLQIVQLAIQFQSFAELVPGNQAAPPLVGLVLIPDPSAPTSPSSATGPT